MECGSFYGRRSTRVSDKNTTPSRNRFRDVDILELSRHSTSTPASASTSDSTRGSTGVPVLRRQNTINEKLDNILKAFDEQKRENMELKEQLTMLQEKIEQTTAVTTSKQKKIPYSLSVSSKIIVHLLI